MSGAGSLAIATSVNVGSFISALEAVAQSLTSNTPVSTATNDPLPRPPAPSASKSAPPPPPLQSPAVTNSPHSATKSEVPSATGTSGPPESTSSPTFTGHASSTTNPSPFFEPPAQTSRATTQASNNHSPNISGGSIAGIVVACLTLLVGVVFVVVLWKRRTRARPISAPTLSESKMREFNITKAPSRPPRPATDLSRVSQGAWMPGTPRLEEGIVSKDRLRR